MPHGEGQPEGPFVDRVIVQLQSEMQGIGGLTVMVEAGAEPSQNPSQDEGERLQGIQRPFQFSAFFELGRFHIGLKQLDVFTPCHFLQVGPFLSQARNQIFLRQNREVIQATDSPLEQSRKKLGVRLLENQREASHRLKGPGNPAPCREVPLCPAECVPPGWP